MKAIQISRTGGPEVLDIVDLPMPKPGPGEVLVKAHAIGVAYFDMLIRSGRYPWMPDLPYVPGNEMSGRIADANGAPLTQGHPVYVANWDNDYKGGFYAEYLVASAAAVRPLAASADLDRAAALSNYVVASCLLTHGARGIEKGTMAIHGAAGGVGLALCELGRLAGFKVLGIASSDEKCALLAARGVEAINSTKETVADRVLELTGGRGADLICNHIAGNSFACDLTMVAPFGLIVSYGALGGLPAQDLFRDMRKNIDRSPAVRCFTMHAFDEMPALRDHCTDEVLRLFADGTIVPHLGPALPLTQAAKAHAMLEQRGVVGKIVLKPASK
jgi:NADPH2:quinone reductase